jgi:2-desacetyl-2-hydroxyethyl bacteriochlorophyllide A dehydrogenase
MSKMSALVVPAAGRLEIQQVALPQIGPYQALVRMEVCGICNSTDHKLIEGTMSWAPPFPFVLGHESVGKVVEVGGKVTKFKIGDRVTRPTYQTPPGESLNAAMGGFAQYGIVTDAQAMAADGDASLLDDYNALRQLVVPAEMSARDAALCISLSETASVLRHFPNPRGRQIVVAGTGVAGLAFVLWFKLAGARVIALGRRETRLQHAQRLGADVVINTRSDDYLKQIEQAFDGTVDGLIEATGDAPLAEKLLQILKPEGFASAYGVPPTGTDYHERWQSPQVEEHLSFAWVANLLRRGWISPAWFVSHQWEFEQVTTAFDVVKSGEVSKGFVVLNED